MDNIYVRYYDMPCSIRSYVISNDDGSYTIVINSRLGNQMQEKAYLHEIRHITNRDYERKCPVGLIEINAHQCD